MKKNMLLQMLLYMRNNMNNFLSNLKSISLAVFIALLIRSFVAEPFNIPSGSMKPNLLVGDFIFVTKWSYGYSRHSLPFSIPLFPKKIFPNIPKRGDVAVFKTPEDNRTDYIKRVIGLPGDIIKITNGVIYLNERKILRKKLSDFIDNDNNVFIKRIRKYEEYHDNLTFEVLDIMDGGIADNTEIFTVPEDHFFVMGDNRDNSQDSRFKTVGFIPLENLVGKARFIFFSLENSRFLAIWKWPKAIRGNRIFKRIL